MSLQSEHFNPIKPPSRKNKNFVYNRTKYPVDFSLVKKYSNYFYNNRDKFKPTEDIEIKPDNYDISEESIPMFISFCQNEPFDINDSNIFDLHQLSIQYEITILTNLTQQYISKKQKSLVFQIINYKLHNQNSQINCDLSYEEEIIASNFFEYINDDQLPKLPVPILYKIINNEHLQFNSMNLTNQGQFIEFLFKCLDEHKREASVLFLNLDIETEHIDLLSQILARYPSVFDFSMMNAKLLAKNASHLLSELQKLKIEYSEKLSEMAEENKQQRESFKETQKSFDESKSELLNANRSLEQRLAGLEREMASERSRVAQIEEKLERYTSVKVSEIKIHAEPKVLFFQSRITFSVTSRPKLAFNDDVEWQIEQGVEGSVQVESMNERELVLKGLIIGERVTVVARALDGSDVRATKEVTVAGLNVVMDMSVQQDKVIRGTIITTEEGGALLDKSKSKYVLNENGSSTLEESAYESASPLDSLAKEVSFSKPRGTYYLHVFVADKGGNCRQLVSRPLETEGIIMCFDYTGSVQPVQLEPGRYKLEVWGAQGGSFDTDNRGGYSTGTISLEASTTLYVVVGGSASSTTGGFNGGGNGGTYQNDYHAFGGGGASHIGLKSGMLDSFASDYSSSLLIVAGGGGGCNKKNASSHSIGGNGGGCAGSDGESNCGSNYVGTGAAQSSGGRCHYSDWEECGSFGCGSNCGWRSHPGYILGGGGGGGNCGPGGGSGYINASKLSDASMRGYYVPASSSAESRTTPTTSVFSEPTSNAAKQGSGYVRITPL